MKNIFTFCLCLLVSHLARVEYQTNQVATISSVQNGSWHSNATWSGGVVPTYGDDVTIAHTVSVTDTAKLMNLHYATGGVLEIANFQFLKMKP